MYMIKKENFIYEKENSIPKELCEEIIEQFETKCNINIHEIIKEKNGDNLVKYNEYNVKCFNNLMEIDYTFCFDHNYDSLQKILEKELKENLKKYFVQFKNSSQIPSNKNNNSYYSMLNVCLTPTILFTIQSKYHFKKDSNNTQNIKNYNKKVHSLNQKIKLFRYIWCLNDYPGDILFWNNYPVKIQKGKLIIFPISWCFPYIELLHSENTQNISENIKKFVIYGDILYG